MTIGTFFLILTIIWLVVFPVAAIRFFKKGKLLVNNDQIAEEERNEKLEEIRPMLKACRGIGWMLLIIGSIILIGFLPTLLDPEATISVNSTPRSDLWTKISSLLFIVIFPIIGSLMAFFPQRRLESLFLSYKAQFESYLQRPK